MVQQRTGSTNSIGSAQGVAIKEQSVLDRCIDIQQQNQMVINQASGCIENILNRLRGEPQEDTMASDAGSPVGRLLWLEEDLNRESQSLGRMLADLQELDRLL